MEFKALLLGLQLAYSHHIYPLEVETVSVDLLRLLNKTNSQLSSLVSHSRFYLKKLANPLLRHNFGEANRVAHLLAMEGNGRLDTSPVVFWSQPSFVTSAVHEDMQLSTVCRKVSSMYCSNLARLGN
ncbi:hypothetical protein FXO38_17197, partial [Capsicum annuum]